MKKCALCGDECEEGVVNYTGKFVCTACAVTVAQEFLKTLPNTKTVKVQKETLSSKINPPSALGRNVLDFDDVKKYLKQFIDYIKWNHDNDRFCGVVVELKAKEIFGDKFFK